MTECAVAGCKTPAQATNKHALADGWAWFNVRCGNAPPRTGGSLFFCPGHWEALWRKIYVEGFDP